MSEPTSFRMPPLAKTIAIVGDILLLVVAYTIVTEAPHPLPLAHALLLTAAVLGGAVMSIVPFVVEHKAAVQMEELDTLKSAAVQLTDLQQLTQQIRFASSQWQTVQENCTKTVAVATEMGGKMVEEGKAFSEFMRKTTDAEKTHLRLEIDKLKRAENDWLEVVVRICDHVFALHKAAVRSGQSGLIEQLSLFQRAVRDSARRIGLVAHEATENEPFDERLHQLVDPAQAVAAGAIIAETVATGYTMQGQPIRRIVVALKDTSSSGEKSNPHLHVVS